MISVLTSKSGDWVRIIHNHRIVHDTHSIRPIDLIGIFKDLGFVNVEHKEVTEEELLNYG